MIELAAVAMPEPHLTCAVVWSDPDLLEIRTRLVFGDWAGAECGYVTREEARAFTAQLEDVVEGATAARLDTGQPDLSWVQLEVFEYGAARRLGLRVALGRAEGTTTNLPPDRGRAEFRITTPLERGQLLQFARALRRAVAEERGGAYLPIPRDWPD